MKEEKSHKQDTQNLGEDEKMVMQILVHPMQRDELLNSLKLSIKDANILLSSMELKGLIIERLGELRQV